MHLDKVKRYYQDNPLMSRDVPIPCTEDDVQYLESIYGFKFPDIYREFLFWMGRGAGGFLSDCYLFYRSLELKTPYTMALEILEENNSSLVLPEDAFVFFSRGMSGWFCFMKLSEGSESLIYGFYEGDDVCDSFRPERFHFKPVRLDGFLAREINNTVYWLTNEKAKYLPGWSYIPPDWEQG